jgi:hypothetical protein
MMQQRHELRVKVEPSPRGLFNLLPRGENVSPLVKTCGFRGLVVMAQIALTLARLQNPPWKTSVKSRTFSDGERALLLTP